MAPGCLAPSEALQREAFGLERRHPLGVYPLGNALLDPGASRRRATGLGRLARCGDEALLGFLRALPAEGLARFAASSNTFRAFAGHEELWKDLCLQLVAGGSSLKWAEEGSWKATYGLSVEQAAAAAAAAGGSRPSHERGPMQRPEARASARVYSDVLHRSFFFAVADLDPYWLSRENIARVDARKLTTEAFVRDFERKGLPVLLEGANEAWPAMKTWSKEQLIERFGDVPLTCGPCDLPLREFYAYADRNLDDSPLFVFCRQFHARAPDLLNDYEVPEVFRGRDLFDLLGDRRPANRWLLIGNRRSASKWHIDPNKTSAWNAVVRGRKRWLLLPPGCTPPGVFSDGAEVTQPVSLVEWFSNFYRELRRHVDNNPAWDLKEVTCGAGDCVFVPCGWWHCVLNLDDDTVAVTQNYCSETIVHSVRRFLKEKSEQVSGVRSSERATLWQKFDEVLAKARPDFLAAEAAAAAAAPAAEAPAQAGAPVVGRCGGFSFWDHLRSTGKPLGFTAVARDSEDAASGDTKRRRAA